MTMEVFLYDGIPLILAAISLVVCFKNSYGKDNPRKNNHRSAGLYVGFAVGIILSTITPLHIGTCTFACMMIGEAVGSCIRKKDKPSNQD